ncbi:MULTISPECIES: hypothetical protein [unclassified Pseudoclavibacter]|uniref:hypothetical protein n=1 Tax=unclassified Pseudoclavibacter TaxID=2615177 RepID=UPI0011B01B05|nr:MULTISPECIES: hypothetical protein [unclassified Pseudoclavibacter]
MDFPWPICIGETLRRRRIHEMLGGQQQQGISTPRGNPNILIFTDPKKGQRYGYDLHEGLRADGIYAYTGEGTLGNQQFLRGNAAIMSSVQDGRLIRLFTVRGVDATYVGAFTLADPAFEYQEIPDVEGGSRRGIIFLLAPVDADVARLMPSGAPEAEQVVVADWVMPEWGGFTVELQPRELEISRVEFNLQAAFGTWLKSKNHVVQSMSLTVGNTRIRPDFYDSTAGEVIEAKKSTARSYVRTAIGQSLDYAHNARRAGYPVKPAILMPGRMEDDLSELCRELNVRVHTRVGEGFVESDW